VYGLLNDDETNGIYNELVTIYKRIIDNIIWRQSFASF
jgi:hypothetical protein